MKKLTITYIEPDMLHPNSDEQTISDISKKLECKYHLLEKFSESIMPKLVEKLAQELLRNDPNRAFVIIEEYIKDEWRDYIVNEKHGIKTKASTERGSEAFIDTGAYFKGLRVQLRIT